jgi:hypothetical protein
MHRSTHFATVEPTVKFGFPGFDGDEVAYPQIKITFSYLPGSPGRFNPINGGFPPDPAEIEVTGATLLDSDGLRPLPDQVREWAERYAEDEGYEYLCELAERDIEAARYPDI